MFRLPLCVWLCCNIFGSGVGFGMLGEADMMFKTVTECEEPVNKVKFAVTQKRHNRSVTLLDITVDNDVEISDDLMLELQGARKTEGGYKPGGMYMMEPACKTLNTMLGDVFKDILNAAGVEDCPLPAGHHAAMNYFFNNEEFTVPQVFGEYKTEGKLYKEDELLLCAVIYYDFQPKSLK